jgi:DNA-binding MarR family transcriptional regulator
MPKMETTTISTLSKVLQTFRDENPDMSLTQALTILSILRAGQSGTTVKDVAEDIGITVSSASRNVRALLPAHRKGNAKGLDLINYEHSIEDARLVIATPNADMVALGKRLVKAMKK